MTNNRLPQFALALAAAALVLAACQSTPTEEAMVPSVNVSDQEIRNGTLTIAEVVSDGPGWLVVHAQADGKPGPILGFSPVTAGQNLNISVEIDPEAATETLYTMLHSDGGEVGAFEFPNGPDTPVAVDGQVVTPSFNVTGLPSQDHAMTPSVLVSDQEITNGSVTISEVVSNGPGWLVVHAQVDGKPGPILGFAPVVDGKNSDVTVEIDAAAATETMYAMLHTDAGEIGTFEFPDGDDTPVAVDGQVVTPSFSILGSDAGASLNVAEDDQLGAFLVDEAGLSLYVFLNDEPGTSNCYDACAATWPPLIVDGEPVAGDDVDSALLGTTLRDDGSAQVTYNGWPLYYFAGDAAPGDLAGQNINQIWFVMAPDGEYVTN